MMIGGVRMKKYIWLTIMIGALVMTGCGVKNNDVTDNNDDSDIAPTTDVAYQTMTCTKDNTNAGVKDASKYIVKHDGENVKSITMKLDYNLENETGKEIYDKNKSLFTNIADKFEDLVGLTTNVIEDTASLFRADIELAIDKMDDSDLDKFEDVKLSKSLKEQKKHFEEAGMKCSE